MNNNILLPNTIIAGTNKAGTTSIFRYLGDHPDVCTASVKETRFFTKYNHNDAGENINEYSKYFRNCAQETPVLLEASPQYMQGGLATAKLIHKYLPDVRLVFVLREPVERMISFFHRNQQRGSKQTYRLSADDFVEKALSYIQNDTELTTEQHSSPIARQIRSVRYAPLLDAYYDVFPSEQIYVTFFDDLRNDTQAFMKDIARFLHIDPGFYSQYEFHIENKTRSYRSNSLQHIAFRLNMALEPLLNSAPGLRRKLRNLYNLLNQSKDTTLTIDPGSVEKLRNSFIIYNKELSKCLLNKQANIQLPKWLE